MKLTTPGALALVVLASTGCAVPGSSQLENETRAMVAARTTVTTSQAADPEAPLTAEAAVREAMASSPEARAIWARLGIAEGEVRDALRVPNPTLGWLQLSADGGFRQTTWSLSQDLLDLLFTGYRRTQGKLATQQAMQQCAAALLQLEAGVRAAFVEHSAAVLAQQVSLREKDAAQLSAQLAAQYLAAGNLPEIALRREEAAASEAALRSLRREVAREQARSRLLTLLGRSGDASALPLDTRLGWHAGMPADTATLQAQALQQRLDLSALRVELALRRVQSTHTGRWRGLPGVTLQAERETETGSAPLAGGGVALELPVFDSGRGRTDRARSLVVLREAQLRGLETRIRNDVAALRAAVIAQREAVDSHARLLLQRRERIVQLTQQQADFMLVGTFDLIAAREQQIAAYQSWIDAVAQLALAQIRLAHALGGPLPADSPQTLEVENLP